LASLGVFAVALTGNRGPIAFVEGSPAETCLNKCLEEVDICESDCKVSLGQDEKALGLCHTRCKQNFFLCVAGCKKDRPGAEGSHRELVREKDGKPHDTRELVREKDGKPHTIHDETRPGGEITNETRRGGKIRRVRKTRG
jgi:hypothetical protein